MSGRRRHREQRWAAWWAEIPPRPDPQSGEPFPPPAPVLGYRLESAERRMKRQEARRRFEPHPPPGAGPVLAWYRERLRSRIMTFVLVSLGLVGVFALELLVDGYLPNEWFDPASLAIWFALVGVVFLSFKPWRKNLIAAGADWVLHEKHIRRSRKLVQLYDIAEVHSYSTGRGDRLRLTDAHGGKVDLKLDEWQVHPRVWALVYNGILHSVATGAQVHPYAVGALELGHTSAMALNAEYSKAMPAARDGRWIDLRTRDGAGGAASTEVRRSGILCGETGADGAASVWIQRRSGARIAFCLPPSLRVSSPPVELLNADGRVGVVAGDMVLLTGTIRDSDGVFLVRDIEKL